MPQNKRNAQNQLINLNKITIDFAFYFCYNNIIYLE